VASVLTAMGRLADAEGCIAPAVAEARQRPPNKALANLLGSLGAIRAASGDAAQAESLHRAALDIATHIGDPVVARQCHKRLADLFADVGRWQEAYEQFRRYHELNESTAGAKAAKRLTIVRIADEVDALHDALDPGGAPADGATAVNALEALTGRLRAQNRELAEAKRAADAASEAKSRFLSNMSHELRTPLNGVLGMAQLLLRTPLDSKQSGYCRVIVQSGQALSTLVSDILDYSRMSTGRLVLETAEFEPAHLVDEVLQALGPAATARGLVVGRRIDPGVPAALLGDGKRVRQVLQHLVDNAVKFTRQGGVDVQVSALGPRDGDARFWVRFAVADTGIGMDPKASTAGHEPFVLGDDSNTRAHGGIGLGLAISRHLVGAMGGQLSLESTPGKGSTFWFDIPLHTPAAAATGS
jgi:signal transduction histidine kinase